MPTNPQPGLKLSDEVVERLAQHLADYYGGPPRSYSPNDAEWRLDAERALTAALRLDDPETVERVAKALADDDGNGGVWRLKEAGMESAGRFATVYREKARAAIAALLGAGAEPEEADGG